MTSGKECILCPGNSIGNSYGECHPCGYLSHASDLGSSCQPCPHGSYVHPNEKTCITCSTGSILYTYLNQAPTCNLCLEGTYVSDSSTCSPCAPNSVAKAGSTACTPCPIGYYTMSKNRTACFQCPARNSSDLVEYIQQAGAGCDLHCIPSAYLHSSPTLPGGCLPCTSLMQPAGTYPSKADCRKRIDCTGLPLFAMFNGPGTKTSDCPWQCQPSYYLSAQGVCTSCSTTLFNSSKHVYIGDGTCAFTCKPTLHRTVSDNISCPPCIDLYPDGSSKQMYARLRQYKQRGLAAGPSLEVGMCGTDAVIPGSSNIFLLTKARYVWLGSSTKCGNSLLESGEQCDDGNTKNNDGCDSACKLELNSNFDCDLIGSPCQASCGWPSTAASGGLLRVSMQNTQNICTQSPLLN